MKACSLADINNSLRVPPSNAPHCSRPVAAGCPHRRPPGACCISAQTAGSWAEGRTEDFTTSRKPGSMAIWPWVKTPYPVNIPIPTKIGKNGRNYPEMVPLVLTHRVYIKGNGLTMRAVVGGGKSHLGTLLSKHIMMPRASGFPRCIGLWIMMGVPSLLRIVNESRVIGSGSLCDHHEYNPLVLNCDK